MHNVVFDISVLVSALITRGKSKELWLKAVMKEFDLIASREILSQFIKVAGRARFRKYVKERDVKDFLEAFNTTARFTSIKSRFKVVKQDPDDDIILRTAYDSGTDYVVSGDEHLLALKEFRGIRIVTVSEMLELLKKT